MFFCDDKILSLKLAPNWFTNVKVIEITLNPEVSGTGPFEDTGTYFEKDTFRKEPLGGVKLVNIICPT